MTIEIAERLKEERKRKGVKQKLISELTGMTERGYRRYEANESEIDVATLLELASTGMDIFYIIFGKRLANTLSPEEQMLVEGYRAMNPSGRAGILGMIAGMRGVDSGIRVQGKVSQYAEGDVNSQYVEGNAFTVNWEKKPR